MRDAETLERFRRLKPHYGAKIDKLWTAYAMGDRDERQAIEDMLRMLEVSSIQKTPDDKTVNLPPPPKDACEGKFHLGTVLYNDKPLHDFSLPDATAIRTHLSVFGRTGAGKTNLLFHLLDGLRTEGIPTWIFDWKRDYRSLLKHAADKPPIIFTVGRPLAPFRFNPLFPPTGSEREMEAYHERLIDVIGRAFYTGHGVAALLRRALKAARAKWRENPEENPLNFKVLHRWIEQFQPVQRVKGRRSGDWTESALRALESLCLGRFGEGLNVQDGMDLAGLMKRDVVFELDALADAQKTFFVESLLLWLRQYLLNRSEDDDRDRLKLVLVVEEAHHVLKAGREEAMSESVLEVTLRETRSLGMGLIIVDQAPSLINQVAFSNTFTSVFFSLKGRPDIRAAAGALLLARDQEEYLGRLPVGAAIVKLQDGWFDPFLIHVPHIKDKDQPVRDEEVKRRFQAIRGEIEGLSGVASSFRPEEDEQDAPAGVPPAERKEQLPLNETDLELLQGVLKDPLVGMSKRYRQLGVSTRHGNEAKDKLVHAGLARPVDVPTPTGRLRLLELTPVGEHLLADRGLLSAPLLRNGAEHRYWKQRVAEHFTRLGYATTIEKVVVNGKRVDVEAVKGDERVAIEVETSRSHSTSDFPLDLKHYPKLIILATDPTALEKVTAALDPLPKEDRARVTVWMPKDLGHPAPPPR